MSFILDSSHWMREINPRKYGGCLDPFLGPGTVCSARYWLQDGVVGVAVKRWEVASSPLGHLSTPASPSQVPLSPLALWQWSHALSEVRARASLEWPWLQWKQRLFPSAFWYQSLQHLCVTVSFPSPTSTQRDSAWEKEGTKYAGASLPGWALLFLSLSHQRSYFLFVLLSRVRKTALSSNYTAPHLFIIHLRFFSVPVLLVVYC